MAKSMYDRHIHGRSRTKPGKFPFGWYPGICGSCGIPIDNVPFEYEPPISKLRRNGAGLNETRLRGITDAAVKSNSRRIKVVNSTEYKSITQAELEYILDDGMTCTKKQIAELGSQCFGISRSKLMRLRKDDALEWVRAALRNERILDLIEREAQRVGPARRA